MDRRQHEKEFCRGLSFSQLGREIGNEWKQLSKRELKKYHAMAENDKKRYIQECKDCPRLLEKRKRILEKLLEIGDSDEIVLVSERVAREKRKEEHRKNTIHHRNWLTGEVQTVGQHEEIKQLRKNRDDRAKELRSKARTEITELTKEIKKKRQRLEDDLRNLFDQHDKDSRRIETRKRVKKSKR